MAKTVSVRVGLDVKDAVDNGIKLDLPLVFLWRYTPYRKRLEQMGFDTDLADDLTSQDAWRHIGYTSSSGFPLDCESARRRFAQVRFWDDSHISDPDPQIKSINDMPKHFEQLGKWLEAQEESDVNGPEPVPEPEAADESLDVPNT